MNAEVITLGNDVIVSRIIRVLGIGEGHMVEKIADVVSGRTNPTVAYYIQEFDIALRITARAKTEVEAMYFILQMEEKIRERLGEDVYGDGDITIEEVIGNMLIEKKMTIATAESCTGGLLAGRLINYPGVSSAFMEGMITYSNEAKMKRLGVHRETLEQFGAVSEETAREMAIGISREAKTDIGISITGIAGPGGGTGEKPVGLVYVGICINGKVGVKKFNIKGDRNRIRQMTVINTLDWLRRELKRYN